MEYFHLFNIKGVYPMGRKIKTFVIPLFAAIAANAIIASCSKPMEPAGKKQLQSVTPPPVAAKSAVESIDSLDELTAIIEGKPETLLVFDLYAEWCRPCRMLAPTFNALADAHSKNARFYRIDIDRSPEIASAFQTYSIPLVVFMKNKEVVHSMTGLNPRENYERVITACGPSVPAAECRMRLEEKL
jgi:thioredoxin 1